MLNAVVGSFYPELVQAGRLAKERAQHMLSAVTVLSAALIAALVAGGAGVAATGTKIAVLAAVAAWVMCAGVFAWAASPKRRKFPEGSEDHDFVQRVIDEAAEMEEVVESRLRLATNATLFALAISIFAFGYYLFSSPSIDWQEVSVSFETTGESVGICNGEVPIKTMVDSQSMTSELMRIRFTCAGGSTDDWLVSRDHVTALRLVDQK